MSDSLSASHAAPRPSLAFDTPWRMANWNGAVWAWGNGMVSTTLISYFAQELGASRVQVSWILAFPHLVGVLRLLAPWLLETFPNRKGVTIVSFVVSGLLLLLLPIMVYLALLAVNTVDLKEHKSLALGLLIALWAGWHVTMYFGLIPFFSWLGDLSTREDRAARFATRQFYITLAEIGGTVTAAWIASYWLQANGRTHWLAYAISAEVGAVCVLLSTLFVYFMPHARRRENSPGVSWREMARMLTDRRYLPLLAFNIFFSLANGFSAAATGIFPFTISVSGSLILSMQSFMRIGQAGLALPAGSSLRREPRWSMFVAQVFVALALLFFFPATKTSPHWLWGAYACWIAYAVLNIGLPYLMLSLSPGENSPSYVAAYYTLNGLAFALASILGGTLLDAYKGRTFLTLWGTTWTEFQALICVGLALRLFAAIWLLLLPRRIENDRPTTAT